MVSDLQLSDVRAIHVGVPNRCIGALREREQKSALDTKLSLVAQGGAFLFVK